MCEKPLSASSTIRTLVTLSHTIGWIGFLRDIAHNFRGPGNSGACKRAVVRFSATA